MVQIDTISHGNGSVVLSILREGYRVQQGMLFNLEVEMEMCTLGKQGCSSAVLRAEEGGHFLLISCLPVSMSHKPNQFVCIHSHHSYMGLSLSLFHCHRISSAVPLSPELSAAPCQGNSLN